ncbi:MAG TPA: hypothetical protein VII08_00385 [Myxococcales bacterium]
MALTKTELKELRKLLEAKHAELVDRVDRSIVAGTRVDDRTFPDSMDAATRVQEEDELIDLASRVRTIVEEIARSPSSTRVRTASASRASVRRRW